jgi:hypothetical protein
MTMTDPTTPLLRADDALKYCAAILKEQTEWIADGISGAPCNGNNVEEDGIRYCVDHEPEIAALDSVVAQVLRMAARFGDPNRYSDGRLVKSHGRIGHQMTTVHVWHPVPSEEKPKSWGGPLPHDPDTASPGVYEVSTDPVTQNLHTCVIRPLEDVAE